MAAIAAGRPGGRLVSVTRTAGGCYVQQLACRPTGVTVRRTYMALGRCFAAGSDETQAVASQPQPPPPQKQGPTSSPGSHDSKSNGGSSSRGAAPRRTDVRKGAFQPPFEGFKMPKVAPLPEENNMNIDH